MADSLTVSTDQFSSGSTARTVMVRRLLPAQCGRPAAITCLQRSTLSQFGRISTATRISVR
ncbi:MAG: hypothetical protein DIU80_007545 [Chloroflexota bacterium]